MSTYIIGIRDPDSERHKNMVMVRRACDNARINYPDEVEEYFGGESEDSPLEVSIPVKTYREEGRDGFEVRIKDLPIGVEIIRFYNCW